MTDDGRLFPSLYFMSTHMNILNLISKRSRDNDGKTCVYNDTCTRYSNGILLYVSEI